MPSRAKATAGGRNEFVAPERKRKGGEKKKTIWVTSYPNITNLPVLVGQSRGGVEVVFSAEKRNREKEPFDRTNMVGKEKMSFC